MTAVAPPWALISPDERARWESDGVLHVPQALPLGKVNAVRAAVTALATRPPGTSRQRALLAGLLDWPATFRYVWSLLGWNVHLRGIDLGPLPARQPETVPLNRHPIRAAVAVALPLHGPAAGTADIYQPGTGPIAGLRVPLGVHLEYSYRWLPRRVDSTLFWLTGTTAVQRQLLGQAGDHDARGHDPHGAPLFTELRRQGVTGLETPRC